MLSSAYTVGKPGIAILVLGVLQAQKRPSMRVLHNLTKINKDDKD